MFCYFVCCHCVFFLSKNIRSVKERCFIIRASIEGNWKAYWEEGFSRKQMSIFLLFPFFLHVHFYESLRNVLLKFQFLPALPFNCPLFTHPPDSHSLCFFLSIACQMHNGSSGLLCHPDRSILFLSARKCPLYL